jgi:serine phosphatase RsbU (regulator of sigma subunit)
VLYIREGDIIRRVAASSQSRPDIAAQIVDHYPVPLNSPGTTAAAIRTGEPQPVPALTPEAVTNAAPQPGLATVMAGVQTGTGWAFPLKERGVAFGAMVFLAAPDATLDKDTVQLAREAADRTANLLVSASAFAEQRAALEALHEVLLPRAVDEIGGLQIVARYVPLSTRGAIGGDWWDALLLPSGNVGLAVGDVAGHGVPSAAVMGQLRNALRMALVSYGGPGESLDALSTFLDWTHPAAHCTAIAATADAAAREVTWSSAGHPPPLLVSAAGEATFLEKPPQAPLGVTGERIAKHVEHVTRLEPGAALLLYTDGLVEGRHRDLDEGLRALAELASDALTMESLDAGADRILASLVDRPDDDVCLLAARLA